MKALRAVNGTNFSWDWDKLIPKDAGIDQVYIDTVIDQINSGTYSNLFTHPNFTSQPLTDLVFLDIGSNLGLVSIYASPACKRIVAVEPAPNVFPILQELTRPFTNIQCKQWALDHTDGQRQIFVNDINFTASSTVNTYGKPEIATCLRLSTILSEMELDHVDVCKVDCEGAEGEALDYLQILNAKDIIKTYFIEMHNCPKTGWEHKLGTITGNLARCGYSKMSIDGMAVTASRP